MPFRWNIREQIGLAQYACKWLLIASPVAGAVGSAVAFFLWALDRATDARFQHPGLLFLLPLAGVLTGLMYQRLGKSVEGGNNLIVDQIHEPGGGVPWRMAPLVLLGTLITHLFGGSAGREGTAVQMGGSLASGAGRVLGLTRDDTRTLLMVGVAAGFGAVFGTPITGAVFAIEVLAIGRMRYDSLLPCLIGAIVGDRACLAWGITHTHYHIAPTAPPWLEAGLIAKVVLAAIVFGLASRFFSELTHGLQHLFRKIKWEWARPALGGVAVIAMVYALGTRDYLGLGVTSPDAGAVTIVSAFHAGGFTYWSWWWKILFTAVTVASGFKGGEVTPLFFIGATLGGALGALLGAPIDLFAGLGFVAVFAGATNTPLACTLMGIELFGAEHATFLAIACFVAYLFSGHTGIYLSQRIGSPKLGHARPADGASLRSEREHRP